MCDPGWDGDMWDDGTPSGKPIGTQAYRIGEKRTWPTEADRLRKQPACVVAGEQQRRPLWRRLIGCVSRETTLR